MREARAVGERDAQRADAEVHELVGADVELGEGGAPAEAERKDGGARGLDLVGEEVEGRERGEELEGLAEGLGALVAQVVPTEVEDCETHERAERGNKGVHAGGADFVPGQLEDSDGRTRPQGRGDERGVAAAEEAVAAEVEALEARALLEDADEAGDLRAVALRAAEQVEAGDVGAGDERKEVAEDVGPLGRARAACVRVPPCAAHADGDGQAHVLGQVQAVDDGLEGLAGLAQDARALGRPELAPDVGGDGGEDGLEGLGVQHNLQVSASVCSICKYLQVSVSICKVSVRCLQQALQGVFVQQALQGIVQFPLLGRTLAF